MSHIKEQIGIIKKGISLTRAPEGSFIHGKEQVEAFTKFLVSIRDKYLKDPISQQYFYQAFWRVAKLIETRQKDHEKALKIAGSIKIKYAHAIKVEDIAKEFNGFGFSGRTLFLANQESIKWLDWELGQKGCGEFRTHYPQADLLRMVYERFKISYKHPVEGEQNDLDKLRGYNEGYGTHTEISDQELYIFTRDMKLVAENGLKRQTNEEIGWLRKPKEREIAGEILDVIEKKSKNTNMVNFDDIENIPEFKVSRYSNDGGPVYYEEEADGIWVTNRWSKLSDLITFKQALKLRSEIENAIKNISANKSASIQKPGPASEAGRGMRA